MKQLEQLTGISLTRLPLSHESLEGVENVHQQNPDLPIPSPFQQQLVIDPPSNALFNDPDTPQDHDHSHANIDSRAHDGSDHHDHHKHHDSEHYQLPEDALLKISPRGHSSRIIGPVIISQVRISAFFRYIIFIQ